MFVAEKVLLLLVISLTANRGERLHDANLTIHFVKAFFWFPLIIIIIMCIVFTRTNFHPVHRCMYMRNVASLCFKEILLLNSFTYL